MFGSADQQVVGVMGILEYSDKRVHLLRRRLFGDWQIGEIALLTELLPFGYNIVYTQRK